MVALTSGSVVGVLALQGDVREHLAALAEADAVARPIRRPDELDGIDALVIPGGESTTMSKLLDTGALREPLAQLLSDGLPVFGTCAGMILLACEVIDGRLDQQSFGAIDIAVRRNAYGRQRDSFEARVAVDGVRGGPFPGVFIRAPRIEAAGDGVEVLAVHDNHPVLARQGPVWVASFHPELSGDFRLHERFLTESEHP